MRGAIAAGNRHSADAGAWALREGGTAVDAAVAATLAAFVMEGPLTGPAGGGFALLHEPGQGATLLDCFFAVPLREAGGCASARRPSSLLSSRVFAASSMAACAAS